jgi:light-regulated signal transduction histidine kinase (bacteriophytochrome)
MTHLPRDYCAGLLQARFIKPRNSDKLGRRADWRERADNGIAIQAKYFAQIFKLFKRLHGRDDYGGGTGTGLTVVRKMVERHCGKIWLDSQPDNGTTFYFTLPGADAR